MENHFKKLYILFHNHKETGQNPPIFRQKVISLVPILRNKTVKIIITELIRTKPSK